MEPTAQERRAHPRVAYGAWVTVKQGEATNFYLSRDLSLGGIFLQADHVLSPDTSLNLLIVVEGERDPIAIKGHVVRESSTEGGFGVRFDAMHEVEAARLLDLVQTMVRQSQSQ